MNGIAQRNILLPDKRSIGVIYQTQWPAKELVRDLSRLTQQLMTRSGMGNTCWQQGTHLTRKHLDMITPFCLMWLLLLSEMARRAVSAKKSGCSGSILEDDMVGDIPKEEDADSHEDGIRLDDMNLAQCEAIESDSDDEEFVCLQLDVQMDEDSDDDSWSGRKEPNIDGL